MHHFFYNVFVLIESVLGANSAAVLTRMIWDFENVASGQIPKGWEIESTNPEGPLATWQVIEMASAPSGEKFSA
jgi:hypothetical protein